MPSQIDSVAAVAAPSSDQQRGPPIEFTNLKLLLNPTPPF